MSIEAAVPALRQTRPFRDVHGEFALPSIAVVKAINRKRRHVPIQTEWHRSKMPINSTIYGRVPESLRAILSKPTDRKRLQSNMRTGAPPFGELAG